MESPDNLPASAAETSHSTALDKAISQSTEVHPASASQHTRNAQVNHEVRDAEGTEPRASDSTATDDEKQYPPTWKLLLLTTGLCFALLLVSLVSCSKFLLYSLSQRC
jgi:hypothetical protein